MSTTIKHVEAAIPPAESFVPRHVGPDERDVAEMLKTLGFESLDALMDATIPAKIRFRGGLDLPKGMTEAEVLAYFRSLAAKNQVFRSFIGMGYSDCVTPPVIQRNIIENPGWYTAYTPYQAEIAQGRLEALLTFQTMVIDLTGVQIANASLLDEATAAAEAMTMSYALKGMPGKEVFLVASECHPQTIDVVKTRAGVRGIEVRVSSYKDFKIGPEVFGALVQYPATDGAVIDYTKTVEELHAADALATVAADLLSLVLLTPPGEWGADIVVGNSQRFGVPLGYGGPHAAYFATKDEFKRHIPGRIIGVSRDADGKPALRMALQTREQHIRREKATSNVCTAQVLLAVVASMYAVYHGPQGLTRIARRVHGFATALAEGLRRLGYTIVNEDYFDTIRVAVGKKNAQVILDEARERRINLRAMEDRTVVIALDETVSNDDIANLLASFNGGKNPEFGLDDVLAGADTRYDERFNRTTPFLTHPVFNKHHAETEMLRYMNKLQSRDLSLVHSMIPLGSCTMKLNATAEMMPITWPGFAKIHPFAPLDQTTGYQLLFDELDNSLAEITGFA
ncbi:MAG TPA: glycine dehydrogenase (aminomethyl-transferring), partial [Gemmatimonadaceae bacterium]|nr:glycine dehydrogenase (aminomethyl-transferring) [Gemmatimonadaceae bacterium]